MMHSRPCRWTSSGATASPRAALIGLLAGPFRDDRAIPVDLDTVRLAWEYADAMLKSSEER